MPKVTIPDSDAKPWTPFHIEVERVAIFADVHVPYHAPRAIEAAVAQAKKRKPQVVLFNGDLCDCYQLSRWEKDPRLRDFVRELGVTRQLLDYVRAQMPRARIVWKLGNHEERYWSYLMRRAPDLLDMPTFQPEAVFGLAGTEIVGDKRIVMAGKLPIIHGHEYPAAVLSPVNAARGYFLRAKGSVLGSHYHQSSDHSEPDIKGRVMAAWSTGCLCDLHPEYARLNRWSHGWAFVEVASDGNFDVDNVKLPHA